MYLAEVDHKDNYKVHALHPDGEMLHFAGRERPAHCMWMCPKNSNISTCRPCEESGSQLAVETRLHGISSLTVTSDGTVHIADVANFKVCGRSNAGFNHRALVIITEGLIKYSSC